MLYYQLIIGSIILYILIGGVQPPLSSWPFFGSKPGFIEDEQIVVLILGGEKKHEEINQKLPLRDPSHALSPDPLEMNFFFGWLKPLAFAPPRVS